MTEIPHAINKQVFDLVCADEGMAGRVQHLVNYYTAPALQHILGEIMDEVVAVGEYIIIQRLEIDLGELTENEFGVAAMLQHFSFLCRKALTEALSGTAHPQHLHNDPAWEKENLYIRGRGRSLPTDDTHSESARDARVRKDDTHSDSARDARVRKDDTHSDSARDARVRKDDTHSDSARDDRVRKDDGHSESARNVRIPTDEMYWEMSRIFLLTGDLPWWADKSQLPDMDKILRRLIETQPEKIRLFFEQGAWPASAIERLRWQYTLETRSLIRIVSPLVKSSLVKALRVKALPVKALPAKVLRARVIGRLTMMPVAVWWTYLQLLGIVRKNEMDHATFLETTRKEKMATVMVALRKLLNHARVFQLEFLLAAAKRYTASHLRTSDPTSTSSSQLNPVDPASTGYISASHLSSSDAANSARFPANPVPANPAPTNSVPVPASPANSVPTNPGPVPASPASSALFPANRNPASSDIANPVPANPDIPDPASLDLADSADPYSAPVNPDPANPDLPDPANLEAARSESPNPSTPDPVAPSPFPPATPVEREKTAHLATSDAAENIDKEIRAAAKWIARKLGKKEKDISTDPLYLHLLQWPKSELLSLVKKWEKTKGPQESPKGLLSYLPGATTNIPQTQDEDRQSQDADRQTQERSGDRPTQDEDRRPQTGSQPAQEGDRWTRHTDPSIRQRLQTLTGGEGPGKILVENAGLCLLAPYLPYLFKNLHYIRDGKFAQIRYTRKAIYLMQYLATGVANAPEYLLPFNKILAGVRLEEAMPGSVRLTKKEMAEAENMLRSVIANWPALRNTSMGGLRGSFLCRKGILRDMHSHWVLQVERKEYDILLNGIPWGYAMVKLPWMEKHIMIEW